MLVPTWMGTNMAAGNQQKHLSLSFATEVTGSRGVLFDCISSKFTVQFVARIDLSLIQIAVCDRTVNMRSCYASVEILSYPHNEYRSTVYCGPSLVVINSKKRDKG